uniref:Uncharacterized protein n=1 Tax=Rhizophora mucronata TaxID=61149 RepID=A0A2P2NIJ3_RHIMU
MWWHSFAECRHWCHHNPPEKQLSFVHILLHYCI